MGPTTGTNRTHSTAGYQTLTLPSSRRLQLPLALNAVLLDQSSQSACPTKSVHFLPAYILVTEQQIKGSPLPSKACVVTTTQLARPKERALPSLWAGNQNGGQGQERIHHVLRKMKCFSLGLAHSQFLPEIKKDVRLGGATLEWGGRGQKITSSRPSCSSY